MNERIRCPHWLRLRLRLRLQIGWLTSVEKCRANGAHGLRQTEAEAAAEAEAEAAKAAASALSSHCFCNNDLAHSRRSEHTQHRKGVQRKEQRERERGRGGEGEGQSTTAERAVKSVSQHNTHKELFCELQLRLRLGE